MAQILIKYLNELNEFTLGDDDVSIGRHPANTIVLQDEKVSRKHALIIRRDDHYRIVDRESTHGLYLNGEPVTGDQKLTDGDVLAIGDARMLFRVDIIEPRDRNRLVGQAETIIVGTGSQEVVADDLDEDVIAYKIPSHEYTTAERLTGWRYECLTRVALTLQTATDLDELLGTLLGAVFEIFRPARGAILIRRHDEDAFDTRVKQPDEANFVVSRTIVDYVVSNQMSVLVAEMEGDERFIGAASVLEQSISAAICCPLISRDRVLGVLYLDTQSETLSYRSEDIALLSIIAANAAMAIENANLLRRSREASGQAVDEVEPLIAHSASMQAVMELIQEIASRRDPVLIRGEPGTGKYFISSLIHQGGESAGGPFLTLDCARVFDRSTYQILFGNAESQGVRPTTAQDKSTDDTTGGMLQQARTGTLVLRNVEALEVPVQRALRDHLAHRLTNGADVRAPRLLFTTSEDLGALVRTDRFDRALAGILDDHRLDVPRLQDRQEDILPLARYFLARCQENADGRPRKFTRSAEEALLKLRYRVQNVTELRQAVELAAILADGPAISAEHLFTGPTDWSHRIELGLDTNTIFNWLSKAWLTNVLQLSMLGVFLALTITCLVAGSTPAGKTANSLLWGLWWPALLALFLLLGRVWCYLCPISKAGGLIQKIGSLDMRPARWIKNHTHWLIAIFFLLIVWSEHVFHMSVHPRATGIFLVSLFGFATVISVVFKREAFCRYMCPLGNLAACYSIPALLQVHSNQTICSSQCRTHECYRGSDAESGCPSFHHPLYVRDAHFCKLCFQCLRSCPHGSAKLYLRPPLRDIWATHELSSTLVLTCLLVFFLALVMLASHAGEWSTTNPLIYTVMGIACLGLAYLMSRLLPRLLSRDGDQVTAARVAFILALLAWGPLMAFHLGNIPGIDLVNIQARAGVVLPADSPFAEISLLEILQFAVLLFAILLAAVALWRTWVRASLQVGEIYRPGWLVLLVIMVTYSVVASSLVT